MSQATLEQQSLQEILGSCKLALFGGKGGVGKTTLAVACALTEALRHPERNIALLSADPSHSLISLLGDNLTALPEPLCTASFSRPWSLSAVPNLVLFELNFEELTNSFSQTYGPSIEVVAEQNTLLSRDEIGSFLGICLPSFGEIMALLSISDLLQSGTYDLIVLDTAPTGHTLRLLNLPSALISLTEVLMQMETKHDTIVTALTGRHATAPADERVKRLETQARILSETLIDDRLCGVFVVSMPECLPLRETERFIADLKQASLPVRALVINRTAGTGCRFCMQQALNQTPYLKEISATFGALPAFLLPQLADNPTDGRALVHLAESAVPLKDGSSPPPACTAPLSDDSSPPPACTAPLSDDSSPPPACTAPLADSGLPHPADRPEDNAARTSPCLALPESVLQAGGHLPDYAASGQKMLIFGGKGGVGKTSIAAASALHLSRLHPEKRVLVASIDPAHSLGDSLECSLTNEPLPLSANLSAVEIDAGLLLTDFRSTYQEETTLLLDRLLSAEGSGGGFAMTADRDIADRLVSLDTPDLDEFMVFRRLSELRLSGSYDLVILDPAPSGHLFRFLELPAIAAAWIRATLKVIKQHHALDAAQKTVRELLALVKAIQSFQQELHDSACTAVVAVASPNKIVLDGTVELVARMRNLKAPLNDAVINMLRPESPGCPVCKSLRKSESRLLAGFESRFKELNVVRVSLSPHEIKGFDALSDLGEVLYG